jgi:hypothetical protein
MSADCFQEQETRFCEAEDLWGRACWKMCKGTPSSHTACCFSEWAVLVVIAYLGTYWRAQLLLTALLDAMPRCLTGFKVCI